MPCHTLILEPVESGLGSGLGLVGLIGLMSLGIVLLFKITDNVLQIGEAERSGVALICCYRLPFQRIINLKTNIKCQIKNKQR